MDWCFMIEIKKINDKNLAKKICKEQGLDWNENLQVIAGKYNRQKDHQRKEMVILKCPVCNEEFLFEKRNLSSHLNPCCSRKCGGIKSHWNQ